MKITIYPTQDSIFPEVIGKSGRECNAWLIIHEDVVPRWDGTQDGTVIAIVDRRRGIEAAEGVSRALGATEVVVKYRTVPITPPQEEKGQ